MADVLILEKEGFLHTFIEKRQGIITLSGFNKFGYEDRPVYIRKGAELIVDCEYLSSLINNFQKNVLVKRKEVILILPFALTWYHAMDVEELPKNKNEAYEFVMWKINKIIPIPKEQIEMRIESISKNKEITTLLIAITYKTFILEIEKCFKENNIVLPVIMPPSIAILNVLENYLTEDRIVLWLKEKGFAMIIFSRGVPRYIRELDQILPVERLETELYNFISAVSKDEGHNIPEKLIYFDELGRMDLNKFLPVDSVSVNLGNLRVQKNVNIDEFNRYVISAGVLF